MAKRATRVFNILLFNVVLLGIGILILELIFGNWINPDNLNKLSIIRDRTITHEIGDLYESSLKTATYTRDKFGLRGQFENPGEIGLLTVGGSTTDQRYVTDGQTWQDALQQEFEAIGNNIVVGNAGVDGQSTFGHIKNFDYWFPKIPNLSPKYVLFYIGLNDWYKDEGNGYDALLTRNDDKSLRKLLKERSAIYHAGRILYGIHKAEHIRHGNKALKKETWVSQPLQTSYDEIMATRLREYAERLELLIERTKRLGWKAIFVTQPSRYYRLKNGRIEGFRDPVEYNGVQINGVDYYYMMRKLDHVTCSKAKEHGILCIDLSKEMMQECEDDDFYDFAHMTPKGAKKVAHHLFMALKDHL